MIAAADRPLRATAEGKLLIADARGRISHRPRRLIDALQPGDLVIANDAATLPASLSGRHLPSGRRIEVRLASRRSLEADDVREFGAIVFGEGDFHVPTENRPAPPLLEPGDCLALGPLSGVVRMTLGHPRLISLAFTGTPDEIWAGLARYGRPIQYAHVLQPLALWDVWTAIAGPPVAFEPPSAGFVLDWGTLHDLRARHITFKTLTHAAGISSTGDNSLDALLPFDEPYCIPESTAAAVGAARSEGRRIVAIGTTVVRAIEHAALDDGQGVRAGAGLATQRIGRGTRLRLVDAIVSGVHEAGTSHYQLLRAFTSDDTLRRMQAEMMACDYRSHEFGDSVLIERLSAASFPGTE